MKKNLFLQVFSLSLPVLMGYIPLGAAYGILFATELKELPWFYGVLISLIVYAGSGQFLLVSLLAAMSGYLEIALATFLLNSRHLFYGISLAEDLKHFSFYRKHFIIFALTDESYAVIKSSHLNEIDKEKGYFWIAFLDYLYWVAGSVLGILLGRKMDFGWEGVEFSLNALFAILVCALYLQNRDIKTLGIALVVGVFGACFLPSNLMLLLCILITMAILLTLEFIKKHNLFKRG